MPSTALPFAGWDLQFTDASPQHNVMIEVKYHFPVEQLGLSELRWHFVCYGSPTQHRGWTVQDCAHRRERATFIWTNTCAEK
jgi:hypothetical protein